MAGCVWFLYDPYMVGVYLFLLRLRTAEEAVKHCQEKHGEDDDGIQKSDIEA
jgi:hypothetical protein